MDYDSGLGRSRNYPLSKNGRRLKIKIDETPSTPVSLPELFFRRIGDERLPGLDVSGLFLGAGLKIRARERARKSGDRSNRPP
jgi:hypothetical protein